jgi:NADPH:quinone reductase-like Zn-dependent oxidoreductase
MTFLRIALPSRSGSYKGVNYDAADVAEQALGLAAGRGVDPLLHRVDDPLLPGLTRSGAYRGRVVLVGASSGQRLWLGFWDTVSPSLSVQGILFGRELHTPRAHQIISARLANQDLTATPSAFRRRCIYSGGFTRR